MTAQVRRVGAQVWMIDLECGIEQSWNGDVDGASVAVDDHNDAHHRLAADPAEDRGKSPAVVV